MHQYLAGSHSCAADLGFDTSYVYVILEYSRNSEFAESEASADVGFLISLLEEWQKRPTGSDDGGTEYPGAGISSFSGSVHVRLDTRLKSNGGEGTYIVLVPVETLWYTTVYSTLDRIGVEESLPEYL